MCGNYNHNSTDDDLMSNKQPAKDAIELGNSWKSEGDSDKGSVQQCCTNTFVKQSILISGHK